MCIFWFKNKALIGNIVWSQTGRCASCHCEGAILGSRIPNQILFTERKRTRCSFPLGTFSSFPFFKKNVPFFSVLFTSFWRLMRPKRTFHSFLFFSKGRKRTQRTQHSFAKNGKERNVLLQRT